MNKTFVCLRVLCVSVVCLFLPDVRAGEDPAALAARLGSADFAEREAAYEALLAAAARDPEGVLAVLPSDPDDIEVRAACDRLREAVAREGMRRRLLAAVGEDPTARSAAEGFLRDSRNLSAYHALIQKIPESRMTGVATVLAPSLLSAEDPEFRSRGIQLIAQTGPGAVLAIRPLLDDPSETVRSSAIHALAGLKDAASVPRFMERLANGTESERAASMHALAALNAIGEIPRLLPLLEGKKEIGLRVWVMRLLAEFDAPEARAAIERALADPVADVRAEAARLWTNRLRKDKEGLPRLLPFLEDPDPMTRMIVLRAIAQHGGQEQMPEVLKHVSVESQVRGDAMRCLARIGGAAATPHLLPYLKSPDAGVRYDAIQALGMTKDRSLIPGLMLVLEEADGKDRTVYAYAVGNLVGVPWPDNERGETALLAWWEAHKTSCTGDDCPHPYGRQAR